MQLIRADQILRLLDDFAILRRYQFRRNRCVQHILKYGRKFRIATGVRIIGDQMSDQRLGNAGIHTVHRHVIAVVRCPSQCQFRKVSRTDDQSAALVCQIH